MLIRFMAIAFTLFAICFFLLWLATSTKYFTPARLLKILKGFALSAGAIVLTVFGLGLIMSLGQLI